MPSPRTRRATTAALVLGALGAAPTAASAAIVTVTGDDGNPITIAAGAPPTIRNMAPDVGVAFAPGEGRYRLTVTNAGGAAVSSGVPCFNKTLRTPNRVAYSGNGPYTVTVTEFGADDTRCVTPGTTESYAFVIGASTSLTPPPGPFLLRAPNNPVTNPLLLPIALNPGASGHEARFALNATVGPDGAIAGPSAQAFVDSTTGQARATFTDPGVYTFVARPTRFTAAGDIGAPWSPPIQVVVKVPFDFRPGLEFLDRRGPKYRVRATLRDAVARGRVSLSLARGRKSGKFRSIGRATISTKGTISKTFTQRRTGDYRLRISFGGSKLVQGGSQVIGLRISRVFR